jgi:hypothetical protein
MVVFLDFHGGIPAKAISMEQRDWELLDRQLQGANFPRRNYSLTVLMVVAVFFAGIASGRLVVTHESRPIRIASNHTTAMVCEYNGACRIRPHPPAAGTVSAL